MKQDVNAIHIYREKKMRGGMLTPGRLNVYRQCGNTISPVKSPNKARVKHITHTHTTAIK